MEPKRLKSVTVHSGSVVESVEFSYICQNGQKYTAGPWGGGGGGPGGSNCTVRERLLGRI